MLTANLTIDTAKRLAYTKFMEYDIELIIAELQAFLDEKQETITDEELTTLLYKVKDEQENSNLREKEANDNY